MAVESVGKHIEGIQKDDDIIILSGLMWNKQHRGKISDASLTWKLTPGLEVGPISNQFVQCAFPLPLLEATQREQTGRLGPYMRCSFNLRLGYWVSNKRQPKSATIYHSYKTIQNSYDWHYQRANQLSKIYFWPSPAGGSSPGMVHAAEATPNSCDPCSWATCFLSFKQQVVIPEGGFPGGMGPLFCHGWIGGFWNPTRLSIWSRVFFYRIIQITTTII